MGPTVWMGVFSSLYLCGNTIVPGGLQISATTQMAHDRRLWLFLFRSPTVGVCLFFRSGEWEDLQGVSRHYESYQPRCSPSVPIPIINIQCSTFIHSLAISRNQAHRAHRSVLRRHLTEAT